MKKAPENRNISTLSQQFRKRVLSFTDRAPSPPPPLTSAIAGSPPPPTAIPHGNLLGRSDRFPQVPAFPVTFSPTLPSTRFARRAAGVGHGGRSENLPDAIQRPAAAI